MVLSVDAALLTLLLAVRAGGLDPWGAVTCAVSGLGASVILAQEMTRVVAHAWRLNPHLVLYDFDWTGGRRVGSMP
jgi:hypothetical protein